MGFRERLLAGGLALLTSCSPIVNKAQAPKHVKAKPYVCKKVQFPKMFERRRVEVGYFRDGFTVGVYDAGKAASDASFSYFPHKRVFKKGTLSLKWSESFSFDKDGFVLLYHDVEKNLYCKFTRQGGVRPFSGKKCHGEGLYEKVQGKFNDAVRIMDVARHKRIWESFFEGRIILDVPVKRVVYFDNGMRVKFAVSRPDYDSGGMRQRVFEVEYRFDKGGVTPCVLVKTDRGLEAAVCSKKDKPKFVELPQESLKCVFNGRSKSFERARKIVGGAKPADFNIGPYFKVWEKMKKARIF